MSVDRHPYASFVSRVEKPARYLGGEFGIALKDWDKVDARVCLAFPDIYDIGMSHLGFKILYKILNDDPRTLAERCYAPWVDMQAELRTRAGLHGVLAMFQIFDIGVQRVIALLQLGVLRLLLGHARTNRTQVAHAAVTDPQLDLQADQQGNQDQRKPSKHCDHP